MTARNVWIEYWDELPEGQLLFKDEALAYVENLRREIGLHSEMHVLEFGCGYGYVAEALAAHVAQVDIWDASDTMRRISSQRLAQSTKVGWVDLTSETPQKGRTYHLIVVNSVVQYMPVAELKVWLKRWHECLRPGGALVLSDLLPERPQTWKDLFSLLSFSIRHCYLGNAVRAVLRERHRYSETNKAQPLTRLSRQELEHLARESGLKTQWLLNNLSHFASRSTAILELLIP